MSEIKLKPCPFCGREADLSNNSVKRGETSLWSVECVECGCIMDDECGFIVIDRWNRRDGAE